MLRIQTGKTFGHLLRVAVDGLIKEMELIASSHQVLRDAVADVKVAPDINSVVAAGLSVCVVPMAIEVRINSTAGKVNKISFKVRLD